MQQVGVSAMLWAKHLDDGYSNVKMKPEQAKSMTFLFTGSSFMPMVLVFDLSSACFIFTAFVSHAILTICFANDNLMWRAMLRLQFRRNFFQQEADTQHRQDVVLFPLVIVVTSKLIITLSELKLSVFRCRLLSPR